MFTSLLLNNFRNFEQAQFKGLTSLNLVLGPNGSGKTNFLEALAILNGLSLKQISRKGEIVQWGNSVAVIKAGILDEEKRERNLRVVISSTGRSRYFLDDHEVKPSKLYTLSPLLAFTPEQVRLFSGEPSTRRHFIDHLLFRLEPEYRFHWENYYQALRQKNATLKQIKKNGSIKHSLNEWDYQLAENAAWIILYRLKLVRDINTLFELEGEILYRPSPRSLEELVEWENINLREIKQEQAEKIQEILREKWIKLRDREIQVGFTLMGPQRDDFEAEVKFSNSLTMGKPKKFNVGKYASRGQQRLTVIYVQLAALKLLENNLDNKPVWLLDDVFSELDEKKQELLVKTCQNYPTFITSTNVNYYGIQELRKSSSDLNIINLPIAAK